MDIKHARSHQDIGNVQWFKIFNYTVRRLQGLIELYVPEDSTIDEVTNKIDKRYQPKDSILSAVPESIETRMEDNDKLDEEDNSIISQRFTLLNFVDKMKKLVYPLFTPNKKER